MKTSDYVLKIPKFVEVDMKHPFIRAFQRWGKQNRISSKAFQRLGTLLIQYESAQGVDMPKIKADMGVDADARINAVADWMKENFSPECYQLLRKATSASNAADVFRFVEFIMLTGLRK